MAAGKYLRVSQSEGEEGERGLHHPGKIHLCYRKQLGTIHPVLSTGRHPHSSPHIQFVTAVIHVELLK